MGVQPEMISSLHNKVRKLMDVTQKVKDENGELKLLVSQLQNDLRTKVAEYNVLRENHQRLKMAKSMVADEEEVKAAKLRVTKIVREIDKCIALLNR